MSEVEQIMVVTAAPHPDETAQDFLGWAAEGLAGGGVEHIDICLEAKETGEQVILRMTLVSTSRTN